jgi:hypothetical protein
MASDGHQSDTECNEQDSKFMAEGTPVGTNDGEAVGGTGITDDTSQDKVDHSSQSNDSLTEEDLQYEDDPESVLPLDSESAEVSSPARGTGEGEMAGGNSARDNTSRDRIDPSSQIKVTHMEADPSCQVDPANIMAPNSQGTEARSPAIGIDEDETVAGSSDSTEVISADRAEATSQTNTEENQSCESVSSSTISLQNPEPPKDATLASPTVGSDDEPPDASDSGTEDTSSNNMGGNYAASESGLGSRFFSRMEYREAKRFLARYPPSLLQFFLHLLMKASWTRDERKLRQARDIGLIRISTSVPAMLT